jgi:hypothetical protein
MHSTLSAQAEELAAAIREFENSEESSRAQRLQLVQSLEKLTLRLKDPREAIFDHLTNVCVPPPDR